MVAAVREAIYELLTDDGTLTGLLATDEAVYHRQAPQGSKYPFVTFHRSPGGPIWTFGSGADPATDEKWVIKGVARGPKSAQADAIDARLQELLHDAALDIDGQDTLYLRRDQDVDYPEIDGANVFHHVGALYRLVRE